MFLPLLFERAFYLVGDLLTDVVATLNWAVYKPAPLCVYPLHEVFLTTSLPL